MRPVLVIVIAYLIGSIPFGYLIVRAKEGSDVRATGSGGTGATNVSRSAGKAAGILTLMLDALKGAAAVLIATLILGPGASAFPAASLQSATAWWTAAAALAVILGHIFPVWLRFRGGKGIATGVGVFLVLIPAVVAIAGGIFVAIVLTTRYVSLASMVAVLTLPWLVWLWHAFISPVPDFMPVIATAVAASLVIVFAHRQNIERLLNGTENKFK